MRLHSLIIKAMPLILLTMTLLVSLAFGGRFYPIELKW